MNTYKAKIISVSRKIPIPRYPEFDFELEIDDASGTINHKTTLAFLYSANHDSTKTVFSSIDSKTGKPKIDLFERLTLNRSECKVSPSYNNFNIDAWIGAEGEFASYYLDNNN